MFFRSIRTRLIGFALLTIVLATGTILYLSIREHQALYKGSAVTNLDGVSSNLADELIAIVSGDPDAFTLTTKLLVLDRFSNVQYARVYDEKWVLIQQYVNPEFAKTSLQTEGLSEVATQNLPIGLTLIDGALVALKPIGELVYPQGYLLIVTDYAGPLKESTRNLFKSAFPTFLVVLFLSIGAVLMILQRLLNPLIDLSNFARNVKESNDYSLRTQVDGKDEVAELGNNINAMMDTIAVQAQNNQQYTEQLLQQQRSMERLANFDTLTSLPNRQFFMDLLRIELARCRRENKDLAIMFFDLDRFKEINDSLGHETGDLLLVEVSKRIRSYLREGDVLARLGGDEFLIMFVNHPDQLTMISVANRIINGLNEPFKIREWDVQTGVSIGIANASHSDWDISQLVSNADIAMYRTKAIGGNGYTFFESQMLEENKRKLLIANSLASAIQKDEFSVNYQPKIGIDGSVVGFEALLRWHSQKLGFISPMDFIPIAERSGKIVQITLWVVERVLKDLPSIKDMTKDEISVSINLSAHDLKHPFMLETIKRLYKRYHVEPSNIEFEVTESAYLENFDMANHFFNEISRMGGRIALDDFGTGYSSLGYLTKIHIDTLKIDKQFVDHLGDSSQNALITDTIIKMAHNLELRICAEGVETESQRQYLLERGCQELQGYLFSKPLPLDDLTVYLQDRTSDSKVS